MKLKQKVKIRNCHIYICNIKVIALTGCSILTFVGIGSGRAVPLLVTFDDSKRILLQEYVYCYIRYD